MYNDARAACFTCPALAREQTIRAWARGHLLVWNGLFCIIMTFSALKGTLLLMKSVWLLRTQPLLLHHRSAPHVQEMQTCLAADPENAAMSWSRLGYDPMEWTRNVAASARWLWCKVVVKAAGCTGREGCTQADGHGNLKTGCNRWKTCQSHHYQAL